MHQARISRGQSDFITFDRRRRWRRVFGGVAGGVLPPSHTPHSAVLLRGPDGYSGAKAHGATMPEANRGNPPCIRA